MGQGKRCLWRVSHDQSLPGRKRSRIEFCKSLCVKMGQLKEKPLWLKKSVRRKLVYEKFVMSYEDGTVKLKSENQQMTKTDWDWVKCVCCQQWREKQILSPDIPSGSDVLRTKKLPWAASGAKVLQKSNLSKAHCIVTLQLHCLGCCHSSFLGK